MSVGYSRVVSAELLKNDLNIACTFPPGLRGTHAGRQHGVNSRACSVANCPTAKQAGEKALPAVLHWRHLPLLAVPSFIPYPCSVPSHSLSFLSSAELLYWRGSL